MKDVCILGCEQCFHILGESNSDKVQKFKRWFWFIVEKMSLQERQDLVRHCVYYTAIVLFWLPILSKFEQAKPIHSIFILFFMQISTQDSKKTHQLVVWGH